ncbi:DUF6230 family protein [Streptomyces montanisoli]|uniref:Cholesterol esterase n=1 Tax=Streptomyces montanisoli TaxID=2798581 RepID=A0A940MBG3_9ACTN|nr:DUF6230 family protein [Streptomyces montanisoli]MBP0456950.1 cholesterol esterase [Streptomyces montanisoli]
MESPVRGGTRWKRFAVVMVPSVAATAAIGVALSQGALAASFSVSGQNFKVKASKLVGYGFTQYGNVDYGVKDNNGKRTAHPVAVNGFTRASITDLCQSVVTPVPGIGDVTLLLTAGNKGTDVKAKNLYIDLDDLSTTNATFTDINIGVAQGATNDGKHAGVAPGDQDPKKSGGFAQDASKAVLTGVQQQAWATTAGTFKLADLGLTLKRGNNPCYH